MLLLKVLDLARLVHEDILHLVVRVAEDVNILLGEHVGGVVLGYLLG